MKLGVLMLQDVLPALGLFLLFAVPCAVSFLALHYALKALVDVRALKNSTHQIQYVPAEMPSMEELAEERDLNRALDRGEREAMRRVHDIHEESEPLM